MHRLLLKGQRFITLFFVVLVASTVLPVRVAATTLDNDEATTHLDAGALQEAADGKIDFVGTDPASQHGAIVATVSNYETNADGSATAQVKVRNVTSLWYKLYVETVGDVEADFDPIAFEDEQGKYLFLPPEGTSSFAYPALDETVTFNEPDAGLFFTADRSVASGIGALFLQQLEILSRAHPDVPALPHDQAGAIVEVVKGQNEGLAPFIDVGQAIYDGDISGVLTGMSEFGRSPDAIAQLGVAFQEIGYDVSVGTITQATRLFRLLGLTWYVGDFIGQSLGFAEADIAAVRAFDFGDSSAVLDPQFTVTRESFSAPASVEFNASGSHASEGIASYEWDFGDGSTATGETAQHIFYQPGAYEVRLTVTDEDGNTDATTQTVRFFASNYVVEKQTLYEFQFEAQENNEVTGYTWDFGDGSSASGRTVSHTYNSPGEYETTLTLSLASGASTTVTRTTYAGPRPVNVSGEITGDRNWPNSHGPFVLTGNVTVAEGATLTIEPGVEVVLPSLDGLKVEGTLVADAAPGDSVRFRRPSGDDGYGGQLTFTSTSTASVLDHVVIEGLAGSLNTGGALNIRGTSGVELTNSSVVDNQDSGLYLNDGAQPTVENNVFRSNQIGVRLAESPVPKLGTNSDHGRNVFQSNSEYAVKNGSRDTVQAIGNYWGTTSTSVIDDRIYDDDEDSGSGPVIFEPLLEESPTGGEVASVAVPELLAPLDGVTNVLSNPTLSWNSVKEAGQYRMQLSTAENFSDGATEVYTTYETHYVTSDLEEGTTYHWRVRAENNLGESVWSDAFQFATRAPTIAYDVSYNFDGADETSDYHLVAFPGSGAVSISEVLEGEAGTDWTAYRQNEDGNRLASYRESTEDFTFGPGEGFWVVAKDDLIRSAEAPVVEISADGTYTIELHNGWNIISNPFGKDIRWGAVQAANDGMQQPLWSFEIGKYAKVDTFASAADGAEAYYFHNRNGLSKLVLPYTPDSSTGGAVPAHQLASNSKNEKRDAAQWTLALTAERVASSGQDASRHFAATAYVGISKDAKLGLDPHDQFAPPGRFETVSLGLLPEKNAPNWKGRDDSSAGRGATDSTAATPELATEYRPAAADRGGQRFHLMLRSAPDKEVFIHASGNEFPSDQEALLIREATGEHFSLLKGEEGTRFAPQAKEERLTLAVGTQAFVEEAARKAVPPEPKLVGTYPNPFRQQATVAYSISEKCKVRLVVYDMLGRQVRTLVDETQSAGRKRATLRASSLSSGVYVFRLYIGDHVESGRLVLVR